MTTGGSAALPRFLRTRASLVPLGLSAAAVFGVGFVPLFDGPGYEIALAAGLIVPAFAAIATALEVSAAVGALRNRNQVASATSNARATGSAGAAPAKGEFGSQQPAAPAEAGSGESEPAHAPEPASTSDLSGRRASEPAHVPAPSAFDVVGRGVANGAVFGLAAYLTTLVHGLRVGFCDLPGGSWAFALGPFCGAVLGGLWGAVAGEIAARRRSGASERGAGPSRGARRSGSDEHDAGEGRTRGARPGVGIPSDATTRARDSAEAMHGRGGGALRRVVRALTGRGAVATLLAFAGPLAGAAISLGRFYTSPMVFAYDPFAGYFSGTLYDTVIDASGLITYRAGSLATVLAALVIAWHLDRGADGRLRLAWRGRPGIALAGALLAIASVTHSLLGAELGHYQTAGSIARALGGRTEGARCVVLHPRGLPEDDVARFVKDCDAHVAQVEGWFEAKGPERITVYLFGDVRQKAQLMGAADTQIAKPWRHEVYVQVMSYPHPVIGHELAHVIAGAFAQGPFEVGADAGGLLPNPGLIEGVAVAASPREGDLSPAEWAKAMKDLGLLPKLDRLFALSFLGQASNVAYTVSGAFVAFVKETYGAAAVRRWYGGEPLPKIAGASWKELEARFHASLDALALTDAAKAQAKARFDRPGIFGRRCPHVIDACNRRAASLRDAGDALGALLEYARVRQLDPNDAMVRVQMARTRIRSLDVEAGEASLMEIDADEGLPRHVRDRALEDIADLRLAPGKDGAWAAATYRALMERTADEDALRTLEVKALAAETPRARQAVFQFLIGDPGRGADRVRAAELFGVWSAEAPDDGMPHYLMARVLQGGGLYAEAAERLDLAMARKLPTARVEIEALRLRLVGACAVGDPIAARRAYDAYRARPEVPRARRDAMAALVERCTGPAASSPAVR